MKPFLLFISIAYTCMLCAQDYNNPGGVITTCSGNFYDTGGLSGSCNNNDTVITTICSSVQDSCIRVDFTSFNLKLNEDYLHIYDGLDTAAPKIGAFNFINSPGTVTSSNGCLTFKFISDSINASTGWEANISCVSNCAIPIIKPGSNTSLCAGVFYDSGGALGSDHDYGNNENSVTTICSGIQDSCLSVTFTSFDLELNKDYLYIYDGPDTMSSALGSYTFIGSPGTVTSSSGCLTFLFKSDSAGTEGGWKADVVCTSVCADPVVSNPGSVTSICQGKFTDSGGSSGASHDYSNNENYVTTICSDLPANQVQVSFSSFSLENNKDYLRIFDGPDTLSAFLGSFTFINSPGMQVSTSGCLTFHFKSDSSTTKSGWSASITCPGAVNLPEVYSPNAFEIKLFNIPTKGVLSGVLHGLPAGSDEILFSVYDNMGRMIITEVQNTMAENHHFTLHLDHLPSGVYFLRVNQRTLFQNNVFLKE